MLKATFKSIFYSFTQQYFIFDVKSKHIYIISLPECRPDCPFFCTRSRGTDIWIAFRWPQETYLFTSSDHALLWNVSWVLVEWQIHFLVHFGDRSHDFSRVTNHSIYYSPRLEIAINVLQFSVYLHLLVFMLAAHVSIVLIDLVLLSWYYLIGRSTRWFPWPSFSILPSYGAKLCSCFIICVVNVLTACLKICSLWSGNIRKKLKVYYKQPFLNW